MSKHAASSLLYASGLIFISYCLGTVRTPHSLIFTALGQARVLCGCHLTASVASEDASVLCRSRGSCAESLRIQKQYSSRGALPALRQMLGRSSSSRHVHHPRQAGLCMLGKLTGSA